MHTITYPIERPATDMHQMVIDATTFLSHLTPQTALFVLVGGMMALYLFTREKPALVVALTGALYMLPFLISGKAP